MKKYLFITTVFYVLNINNLSAQNLEELWRRPPEESRPWTFWYWMEGAVSKEGITADLEAMKEIGLAGAYLMPVKGVPEKPFITPVVEQLSPLWWEMVDFAFREADRLDFRLAFHVCDGFALAGGPWITPGLSMQKVVWAQTTVSGGKKIDIQLPQPESYQDYYEDIAVFAYPSPAGDGISSETVPNEFSTNCNFLIDHKTTSTSIRGEEPCWIQYAFDDPFTCRSVQVKPLGRDFQSQRLIIETSDDGVDFRRHTRLEPPRQGWQNYDIPATYSIPPVTARYFRFLYDPEGTEPGAEDLDAAKWKPSLKLERITLLSEARIHQYEGKNGQVWRVSPCTTEEQIPGELCIDRNEIRDVGSFVKNGRLQWDAPAGQWTILRMGHTSTGHTNATGGKGAGLECDKFNPEAIRLQFGSWFGKMVETIGKERAARVLRIFHVDSWECGSQNWSPVFREAFKKRRGYDMTAYLPVMAGIPVESVKTSEKVLHDVRQTISELVTDVFYRILQEEAHKKNCSFSAESVAPTMVSDGMAHYRNTDVPMGEFWFESPTHDKPNDMLDAISGAHIYGKKVIQAEAFTQLRSTFTEHPARLKALQDRNYALGVNRLAYHVYTLNPWLDRKPGMTLNGIGLYFQRDQTWWKQGRAWVDYAQRCQALLQFGKPVVDVAVFTGEEIPRRAILPDRLLPFIPGIFGKEKARQERIRMENKGLPIRQMPAGVSHSANILRAEDWINPLRGYAYDSFNRDVLLQAKAENGEIVFPSGMKYKAIIIPGKHPMQPHPENISSEVSLKIKELAAQGVKQIPLFFDEETFDSVGIERDFIVTENTPEYAGGIAYTHRRQDDTDIYFVSNQSDSLRNPEISLRVSGKRPEIWDPVTGTSRFAEQWRQENGRTVLPLRLDAYESLFIVLRQPAANSESIANPVFPALSTVLTLASPWTVRFDAEMRGPEQPVVFDKLIEWNEISDEKIRYYSGTAVYANAFQWKEASGGKYFLELENVYNLATVKINGIDCGTIWTKPYRLDISHALRSGENHIEIEVCNTWANRLMGDEHFNAAGDGGKTWTNARYRLAEKKLVPSGLTGEIKIVKTVQIPDYHLIWDSPSANSGESMPCGGGDIGMNVWVENGDVLFYIASSGTFDENNSLLKLGRVRIRFSPNPFLGGAFRQELKLEEGCVIVRGEKDGKNCEIRFWTDVFNPVIHVEVSGNQARNAEIFYESWRHADRPVQKGESDQTSYKWAPPEDLVTKKDIVNFAGNKILFYHRNEGETVFDLTVRQQQLDSVKHLIFNPLKNLTFGGILEAKDFVPAGISAGKYASADFRAWTLKSNKKLINWHLTIKLHSEQTESLSQWKQNLQKPVKSDKKKNLMWWREFWNRSFIRIHSKDSTDIGFEISRNYQLFRYMQACNASGDYPTRFNGGLFTYDPEYEDISLKFTPDYRRWTGGTFTAQNQRLVYFPMLKSGDFDAMTPPFEFYRRILETGELRSLVYWKHGGAAFTEQIENFGLPNFAEYGVKRPAGYDPGMQYNAWLEYQWDTSLEFCLMILDKERYTGSNISEYLPLIESCLKFFDEHYQYLASKRGVKSLDQNGKLILYPGSGAETYKMAYNATSTIAALKTVTERLLELPENYLDTTKRSYFKQFLVRIPDIRTREMNGHTTIAPAWVWERVNNTESPQLYPVFPWGIYGIGKPDYEIALNTYLCDSDAVRFRSHVGWKQDAIWAARLGLSEEAAKWVVLKLQNSGKRFPAFWGPGFDWTPDFNHGGSGMFALQEMLMQTDGRKILLLPAWKTGWDVHFKLHAPYNTTVECKYENGEIRLLKVSPEEREKDIIFNK